MLCHDLYVCAEDCAIYLLAGITSFWMTEVCVHA